MFDIGFAELLLFGVIALIVLGPEKLPQAARTAGQWYAKIRRTVSTLQSEIEAELDLAETRQQMQKELAKIRQTEADMRREMAEMRGDIKEFEDSQNQDLQASQQTDDPSNSHKNNDTRDQQDPQQPHQKSADYSYDKHQPADTSPASANPLNAENSDPDSDADSGVDNNSHESKTADHSAQPVNTKPWENMWFRLGAYDKARRLPAAPYLPNYKADILLNSQTNPTSHKQAADEQVTD